MIARPIPVSKSAMLVSSEDGVVVPWSQPPIIVEVYQGQVVPDPDPPEFTSEDLDALDGSQITQLAFCELSEEDQIEFVDLGFAVIIARMAEKDERLGRKAA